MKDLCTVWYHWLSSYKVLFILFWKKKIFFLLHNNNCLIRLSHLAWLTTFGSAWHTHTLPGESEHHTHSYPTHWEHPQALFSGFSI